MKEVVFLIILLGCLLRTTQAQTNSALPSLIVAATLGMNSSGNTKASINISDADFRFNKPETQLAESIKKSISDLSADKKVPVVIKRFASPPVIDGRLDDPVWKQAAVFKDFYQTSPGDNIPPSKPTVAYAGYDALNFYIAFYCYDEPDKIRATVAGRDSILDEDNIRLYLDTYNDQRRAYVLAFNPHGIQQDGIYTEGQDVDYSIDIVMESKGAIVSDGWTVEAKIPFKSLRYAVAANGKFWGFNIARRINRFNDERDEWVMRDRNISGFLSQEGRITGLENIKTERTLEVVPSLTLSETGNRVRTIPRFIVNSLPPGAIFDASRFVNEPFTQDIGVNIKFGITPNITLDAAINPDYAEIEADAPVLTANRRFPVFFQEKRPFFLEGAEIFQAPLQTFYSRTIVDPDYAGKLTGKVGKTSFGLLAASDNAPGNFSVEERDDPTIQPTIAEFLDKNAYFGVLRLKRDFGKENNVGFFGTARVFPQNRNFTGGFDGNYRFNATTVSQFQIVGTYSRQNFSNPATDSSAYRAGNGIGYYWNIDHTEKNRGWYLEGFGRSRYYRAEMGFTPRINTNSFLALNRLATEPAPNAKIIRAVWRQFGRIIYDWQGRSQEGFAGTSLSLTFQHNTSAAFEGGIAYERLFEEEFGAQRTAARPFQGAFFGAAERSAYQPYINGNFNTQLNERFSFYGGAGVSGNAFDLDFGAGQRFPRISPAYLAYLQSPEYLEYLRIRAVNPNDPANFPPLAPGLDPGTARRFFLNAGFEYKPLDALRVSLDYSKTSLSRDDTRRTAFDSNIFTFRSTYQFTRFTFVRARVDYDSLVSNTRGQILFGWNPNPGTAFYAGYNDNFNYNGFNPFTGQLEPRFERNNRTFFVRASYLFRKSF